jgi:integrase
LVLLQPQSFQGLIFSQLVQKAGTFGWMKEDMPQHLKRDAKTGGLYSRLAIPADVRHLFDRSTFKRRWGSLGLREVEPEHHQLIAQWKAEIAAARQQLRQEASPLSLKERSRRAVEHRSNGIPLPTIISDKEAETLVSRWFHIAAKAQERHDQMLLAEHGLDSPECADALEIAQIDLASLKYHEEAGGRQTSLHKATDRCLAAEGYAISRNDRKGTPYRIIHSFIYEASIELLQLRIARLSGRKQSPTSTFQPAPEEPCLHSVKPVSRTSKAKEITFSQFIDLWRETKSKELRASTMKAYIPAIDLAVEVFGNNTPVADITLQKCQQWFELCLQVPANAKKFYPTMSILAAIEAGKNDGRAKRARETLEGQVKNLIALFNFAIESGFINENPAAKLSSKAYKNQLPAQAEKRRRFDISELNALLRSELFSAFSTRKHLKNRNIEDAWLTLLGLFSGARLGELCQLHVSDFFTEEGRHGFRITQDLEKGQTLKNANSKRRVPIHPDLIKVGFLDYVERTKRSGSEHLFPLINKNNDPKDAASKRFRYTLSKLNLNDSRARLNFHGLRHTLNYYSWKAGDAIVPRDSIDRILGWSKDQMADRYGGEVAFRKLHDDLSKFKYPGVSLDHLYQSDETGFTG